LNFQEFKERLPFLEAALCFLDLIFTDWFSTPSVLPVSARVNQPTDAIFQPAD
jgi:hypothetical protein